MEILEVTAACHQGVAAFNQKKVLIENDAASDGMLWKHTATLHSLTHTHIYTDAFLYIGALLHAAYTFCYILDA